MTGRGRPAILVAYALVFVGFLLLFFALFERFYAYPRLAKAPEDQFTTLAADGTGTYFSRAKLQEIPNAQFRSTRVVRGDKDASDDQTAVWDTFVTVTDFADGTPISAIRERVAFDRVTSEPVRCCGEDPPHQGIVLKFPFGVDQRSYDFWDATLKRPFPMQFQGEEDVMGVRTYRFQQRIPPTKSAETNVPGGLIGQPDIAMISVDIFYGNTRTVWVEPTTGIVVKGQEQVRQTLRTLEGQDVITLLDGTLAYNDQTVSRQAGSAAESRDDLNLLRTTLPVGAGVLGLVLVIGGLALARRLTAAPAGPAAGRGQAGETRGTFASSPAGSGAARGTTVDTAPPAGPPVGKHAKGDPKPADPAKPTRTAGAPD